MATFEEAVPSIITSQPRNGWIDAGDGLPTPEEVVLIFCDGHIYTGMLTRNSKDDDYYWWSPIYYAFDGVAYWRPITDADLPLSKGAV